MMRRGSAVGSVRSVWKVVTMGLRHCAHEFQHLIAPIARIETEFVLQADHVAGTVVGHFRRQVVGVRAGVVDDVDYAGIVVAQPGRLLDRRNRRHRLVGRQVHGVGRVAGKGCQPAGFRRVGRNEKRSNGIHWSLPVLVNKKSRRGRTP